MKKIILLLPVLQFLILVTIAQGTIPNSVDLIWADMHGKNNDGKNLAMPVEAPHYSQYEGPTLRDILPNSPRCNFWNEVHEMADFNQLCSESINKATNTRVELGPVEMWYLNSRGEWKRIYDYNTTSEGVRMPVKNQYYDHTHRCPDNPGFATTRNQNSNYNPKRIESNGRASVKPAYYYWWHGWTGSQFTYPETPKELFGCQWMRLIIEDPNKPDDRHLAQYCAHVASDPKDSLGLNMMADNGISRMKKITSDWQPFNYMTRMTYKELEANPPPFSTTPDGSMTGTWEHDKSTIPGLRIKNLGIEVDFDFTLQAGARDFSLDIYGIDGRKVWSHQAQSTGCQTIRWVLDNTVVNGVYSAVLRNAGKILTEKLVINK